MPDKSQKKLDELFQLGSEKYDFEYSQLAWAEMEKLLEGEKRRRRLFWWWGTSLSLIIGSVGLIYFLNYDDSSADVIKENTDISLTNEKIIQPNEETSISSSETPEAHPKSFDNIANSSKERIDSLSLKPILQEQNSVEQISSPNQFDSQNETKLFVQPKTNNEKIDPLIRNKLNDQLIGEEIKVKTIEEKGLVDEEELHERKESYETIIQGLDTIENQSFPNEIIYIAYIPTIPLRMLTDSLNEPLTFSFLDYLQIWMDSVKRNQSIIHEDIFLLGLMVGAESSFVNIGNLSAVNWHFGGLIEYRFRGKYSVNLGANYSRKSYKAGEGEYVPPTGFWTRAIAPQSTEATTRILQVPILFGFYPKASDQSGFYVQAGLTSYFMLKERYAYNYDLPDPDLRRKWGTKNQFNHWLGIGQLSIGYNLLLGNKTSLQIEPYIQIPFSGVGHGNVKVWSIGLSSKFNFQIK